MADKRVTDVRQWVVLLGGPPELPRVYRIPDGADLTSPCLVVAFYGRHQHFTDTGVREQVRGRMVPVFRFAYSTAIAE
ncbi:DUF5988 family protein [Streptomyces caatingaensis]|uniref:DUF5988 family protein n=1 Tax=Streptomyces caatingaensis TaxID=1678637 RepID=UPI000672831C|nr:DUF5988 family protein [Streptomyces caatingaensis]